ncbi:hypothetical protein MBM_03606 [Drepanopeziza brunnea f. sp. 'multigermtubi' MB_m1]|uniref:Uncharacterized protein n=1 Tax=Marssonina brunnea f. sp. multigermtubi (strain MB_m1) TaxID=1072389 RepID=K1XYD2_MARBU|nr:uncharacterized protein MBM_03606 [Drepanopeziza brunnea f. sp. 'multigermtubi' MB_m1]EKD17834.1 hypothetical protein MBM_03606 [Drepanopeziza brunnea f. sp. 'multigermtubi' MB_m1]
MLNAELVDKTFATFLFLSVKVERLKLNVKVKVKKLSVEVEVEKLNRNLIVIEALLRFIKNIREGGIGLRLRLRLRLGLGLRLRLDCDWEWIRIRIEEEEEEEETREEKMLLLVLPRGNHEDVAGRQLQCRSVDGVICNPPSARSGETGYFFPRRTSGSPPLPASPPSTLNGPRQRRLYTQYARGRSSARGYALGDLARGF